MSTSYESYDIKPIVGVFHRSSTLRLFLLVLFITAITTMQFEFFVLPKGWCFLSLLCKVIKTVSCGSSLEHGILLGIVEGPRLVIAGLQVVRLGLHLAENPVFTKQFLLLFHEALELSKIVMVPDVKAKGHRGVNLRVVDLFGRPLVVVDVILFYGCEIVGHCLKRVVRVKENQVIFLHAYKIVGLLGSPTDNPTVELLHEEGLDGAKVLRTHLLKTKSG